MKQPSKKQAKRTPAAIDPIEASEIKQIEAMPATDRVALMLVVRSNAEDDPTAITKEHRAAWRRAQELAGPDPTPLAKSLALTVALCEVDVRYRQALNRPITEHIPKDHYAAFNGSMKRYLSACRALALVQRLNLPPIQVNLATNQVIANSST